MKRLLSVGVVALALAAPSVPSAAHASPPGHLDLVTTKAPVSPDGTTAGAVTDLVVTFQDTDPDIPGIGLAAGGTVAVTLPSSFLDTGALPFQTFGTPGCAPPLVTGCNSALLLQGWPQSPQPPFPDVGWDPVRHTIVLTAKAAWQPAGPSTPGPKQVHLLLLGFRNPDLPGRYPMRVEITPDPTTGQKLVAQGSVRITPRAKPSIEVTSLVNGTPPPPFPNSIYQTVEPGDELLNYGFYLWGRNGVPLEGAELHMTTTTHGVVVDSDGRRVGNVWIKAPRNAGHYSLEQSGPAVATTAFLTGAPTALLTVRFVPNPAVTGHYAVTISLRGGNRQIMHVDVTAS